MKGHSLKFINVVYHPEYLIIKK